MKKVNLPKINNEHEWVKAIRETEKKTHLPLKEVHLPKIKLRKGKPIKKDEVKFDIMALRALMNVPKELRICQYLYNLFRDYESDLAVYVGQGGKRLVEKQVNGIDFFYVKDQELIKRLIKGLK